MRRPRSEWRWLCRLQGKVDIQGHARTVILGYFRGCVGLLHSQLRYVCEAVLPHSWNPGTQGPSAVAARGDVGLLPRQRDSRARNGDGSVLAFCDAGYFVAAW